MREITITDVKTETLRRHGGALERYKAGFVPAGESARREMGGPLVPGPWAFLFRLSTVIDNHGGSGRESDDSIAAGSEHWFDHGDVLVIDGIKYVTKPASNENTELIPA